MSTTPYSIQARPDTGFTNGQLGLALGIAAQFMLLGALVASYVLLEVGAAPGGWPAVGQRGAHPLMPLAQPALLLSLVSAVWLLPGRGAGKPGAGRVPALLTALLGLAALALTALDWSVKLAGGHTPASSTFYACYFVLSGVVSAQFLAGLVALGGLLVRSVGGAAAAPAEAAARARHSAGLIGGGWIFAALCGSLVYAMLYHR